MEQLNGLFPYSYEISQRERERNRETEKERGGERERESIDKAFERGVLIMQNEKIHKNVTLKLTGWK